MDSTPTPSSTVSISITPIAESLAKLSLTPTATPTPESTSTPQLPVWLPLTIDNVGRLSEAFRITFEPWELVTALDWRPDGDLLAVAVGERIDLYRSPDWQRLASLRIGAFTHGLAFSPDGLWLGAGSRDGWLRVWNVGEILTQPGNDTLAWWMLAHKKGVNSVTFSPDGNMLASGGNDAVARFWEITSGELLGTTVGGTFSVPSVDFSPDGLTLAIVNGSWVRLREVGTERIVGSFRAENPLFSVAFSPDGERLAAGDNANQVLVWQRETAYRTGQEQYPDPEIFIGRQVREAGYHALIWKVIFSPDGKMLLSAGGDGSIRVWDVKRNLLLAALDTHKNGATSVAFQPQGFFIASGGVDARVVIWGVQK